jgi:hypothetical protein
VLEPYGNASVTAMNKDTVRGALEEGLVSTGRYSFLDRSRIDSVLAEHEFQRSALVETGTRKALGKMLKADLICMTDLMKDGREMSIRVSVIDVETGEIAHSASEYLATDANMFIREAVTELVGRMMAQGVDKGKEREDREREQREKAERETRERLEAEQRIKRDIQQEAAARERSERDRIARVETPAFSQASKSPLDFGPVGDKAVVYVFRDKNALTTGTLPVIINGSNAGILNHKQFIRVELFPGRYTFASNTDSVWHMQNKLATTYVTALREGTVYFMHLEIKRNFANDIRPEFTTVPSSDAIGRVGKCKAIANLTVE